MSHVAPGVYTSELDLSLYAETITNTIFGFPHTFKKGAFDEVLTVTNEDNLVDQLGTPIDDDTHCQGFFAAREYLRWANNCKIVRVGDGSESYAATALPSGTDDDLATGTDGLFSIPATKTLTSATGDFVNDGILVGDVLELHDGDANDGFYVLTAVAATVLTVDRNWPSDLSGDGAVKDFTVWTSKKEGGVDGVTSIPATREFTSALATFTTNGVAAGDILRIHDDTTGPPDMTLDNGMYLITSVDSLTKVTVNRDFKVGGLTALTFTIYSRISAGADGAVNTATPTLFTSAGSKFQSHGVAAGDILYIKDAVDTDNKRYVVVTAVPTETTLTLGYSSAWVSTQTNLDFEVWAGSITLLPKSKGTWLTGSRIRTEVNAGDNAKLNVAVYDSTNSFLQEKLYAVDRANITTEDDSSVYWDATVNTSRLGPVPGFELGGGSIRPYLEWTGGANGTAALTDADFIIGIDVMKNPELYDLNIVAIPGRTSENIGNKIIQFCEKRADCIGLVDPPDWSTVDSVQDILDYSNGTLTRTSPLNSSYAAIYWTWQKVYDEYNETDRWTAPSGHVAGAYAQSDKKSFPWFAPAGVKRAKLTGSSDVRYSPEGDDRELLYTTGQCVNSIVKFASYGITVWGQKTTYRVSSALNRVNVRRMLLYCEKTIATAAVPLTFDPNDAALFRDFKRVANPVLKHVLSNRGMVDFRIVNATTTQDEENSTFRGRMFVKPQKAAEILALEFVVTSQGTDFEELLVAA